MKILKKFLIIIIAIIVLAFLFIYRSYNLKKIAENGVIGANTNKTDILCVDEYKPVCGKDGKTYSNRCVAEKINEVTVASDGVCKEERQTEEISTGDNIGESNLGEGTNSGTEVTERIYASTGTEDKPAKTPEEPKLTADYFKNLKSQCESNSCCISSVDNMESGEYKEAIDGKCSVGYSKNTLKCTGSYTWCEKSEESIEQPVINVKPETHISSGAIETNGGQKTLNYRNESFKYGFSLPPNTYFSGYGSQGGSSHSVGISSGSGAGTFGDNEVKVSFYKGKILSELQDSSYGMYTDKTNGMTYLNVDGNSIVIDGGKNNQKIVDMIIKTIYVDKQ